MNCTSLSFFVQTDVIFFIYLYQKWIYPIDLTRVNEFGVSGEDLQKFDEHGVALAVEASPNETNEIEATHEKNE